MLGSLGTRFRRSGTLTICFNVTAAKVLRPDREALDETVRQVLSIIVEIIRGNKIRFVSERIREDLKTGGV